MLHDPRRQPEFWTESLEKSEVMSGSLNSAKSEICTILFIFYIDVKSSIANFDETAFV